MSRDSLLIVVFGVHNGPSVNQKGNVMSELIIRPSVELCCLWNHLFESDQKSADLIIVSFAVSPIQLSTVKKERYPDLC